MSAFVSLIFLFFVVLTVFVGMLSSLVRVWLEYRLRLNVLYQMEKTALVTQTPEDVERIIASVAGRSSAAHRQDYLLTGGLLATIGLCLMAVGWTLRVGQTAVGIFSGGVLCVVFGILLAGVGLLIRLLRRTPKPFRSAS